MGEGVVSPQPEAADLDIKAFTATPKINISARKPKPVKFILTVGNRGNAAGSATAVLVGVQNGNVVYSQTLTVTAPRKGKKTKVLFPEYRPDAAGDIVWTVTVDGDIPDTATATTKVISNTKP